MNYGLFDSFNFLRWSIIIIILIFNLCAYRMWDVAPGEDESD